MVGGKTLISRRGATTQRRQGLLEFEIAGLKGCSEALGASYEEEKTYNQAGPLWT